MKIARFLHRGNACYGLVEGQTIHIIKGDPFVGEMEESTEIISLNSVEFLPVCRPGKILAVGFNYRDHAEEFGKELPQSPNIFMKPGTALAAHNQPILLPARLATRVDFEAELVVVIGRTARHVSYESALEHVLGYTCGNDVSCRNLQKPDNQWSLCKGFDTFAPVGPWIETELNPAELAVTLTLNGEQRQKTNTRHLIFDVPYLVSYISQIMTLEAGDLIYTGTSSGVGQLADGDQVEVHIQGIGSLCNPVARESL